MIRRRLYLIGSFLLLWPALLHAQFGRPGDAVFYLVTAKGSGEFQTIAPPGSNAPQAVARFYVVAVDSLPMLPSDPFPVLRQTPYETSDELFMIGTDLETRRGIHRIVLAPLKFFLKSGVLYTPIGNAYGGMWFNAPPVGTDVDGDYAITDTKLIFWSTVPWPFLQPTDTRGPATPPGVNNGFEVLASTPGSIKIFSLIPWVNFSKVYPGAGWAPGIDLKMIDEDPRAGATIRMVRIRPGKKTPVFRTAGHTHVLVLQGSAILTPAGSNPVTLKDNDYVFLPENFAVTLSNPSRYQGPGAP